MHYTPSIKSSLFTQAEKNEFATKESRLMFNARNGDVNPLLKYWDEKRAMFIQRCDIRMSAA